MSRFYSFARDKSNMIDLNNENECSKRQLARSTLSLVLIIFITTGCASLPDKSSVESPFDVQTPVTLSEILAEADKALGEGDIDTAQVSYALAVERDPKNVEALYKLGYVHAQKASPTVAVSLLRHALQNDPKHQPSRQLLGLVLLQLERFDEAEKTFNAVLSTDPTAWQSLNGLGVISDLQAEHSVAQEYFEKARVVKPRSAKITNNLGYSYYLAGQYDEAENLFLEAVRFDSDYERAWSNLALVYSRTGQVRDASAAFRKIVSEHQAANNLGYLGLLQGNGDLAKEQLHRAIQISPTYYEVANRNLEGLKEQPLSRVDPSAASTRKSNAKANLASPSSISLVRMEVPSIQTNQLRKDQLSLDDVQSYLSFMSYDVGLVDGKLGESTRSAIRSFQRVHDLKVDGKVGARTARMLEKETTKSAQSVLRLLGYTISKADGIAGTETQRAIQLFQMQNGLAETGELDRQVLDRLLKAQGQVLKQLNSDERLNLSGRG